MIDADALSVAESATGFLEGKVISRESLLIDAPSFAPAARLGKLANKLSRVGVIDIGSNSVRLVVFDGAARSPAYFYNEKVLCGLGRDLKDTGLLHVEGRATALAALKRFVALAEQMKLGVLSAVATAAVREARDGPDFVREVKRTTGLPVKVATGQEEGTLSAQGVLLGWPEAEGVVCDIGGSSMELARIVGGKIVAAETSPLGPLTLNSLSDEKLDAHIVKKLRSVIRKVGADVERLYLVGGSWRAIGRINMFRHDYPLHVLHEYQMPPSQLLETARWVQKQSAEVLSTVEDVSAARMSLAPMAARVLEPLLEILDPDHVAVSSYGLREGLLYAHMTKQIRKRDPLIEAARHMEGASARFPGFGDVLYRWIRPLYAGAPKSERRLIKAACLMHDINWRAHPDYRAEVCFENVTRANLGGLTHRERVFLGLALLNRYRPTGKVQAAAQPITLLTEDEVARATALGRALRMGAMLSGGVEELLHQSKLRLNSREVVLTLYDDAQLHGTDAVSKRLTALALILEREGRIEFGEKS